MRMKGILRCSFIELLFPVSAHTDPVFRGQFQKGWFNSGSILEEIVGKATAKTQTCVVHDD